MKKLITATLIAASLFGAAAHAKSAAEQIAAATAAETASSIESSMNYGENQFSAAQLGIEPFAECKMTLAIDQGFVVGHDAGKGDAKLCKALGEKMEQGIGKVDKYGVVYMGSANQTPKTYQVTVNIRADGEPVYQGNNSPSETWYTGKLASDSANEPDHDIRVLADASDEYICDQTKVVTEYKRAFITKTGDALIFEIAAGETGASFVKKINLVRSSETAGETATFKDADLTGKLFVNGNEILIQTSNGVELYCTKAN